MSLLLKHPDVCSVTDVAALFSDLQTAMFAEVKPTGVQQELCV
jgi:hypothetical protein